MVCKDIYNVTKDLYLNMIFFWTNINWGIQFYVPPTKLFSFDHLEE